MTKHNIFIYVIVAIIGIAVGYGFAMHGRPAGATVENYPDWFTAGIQVGGTNSKIVKQVNCTTATLANFSLSASASTSLDVALPGVSTSSNLIYSFGIATSTVGYRGLGISALPSSTAGTLNLVLTEASGTSIAAGTSTLSVCYGQF